MHNLTSDTFWIPPVLYMQTLPFLMPPTPKAQHLSMDNHWNRVLTLILSTHYPARLQDHHWTLGDREPSFMYKQFNVYNPPKVPLMIWKRRRRNGNEKVATVTLNQVYIRIWSSFYTPLYLMPVYIRTTKTSKSIATRYPCHISCSATENSITQGYSLLYFR